MVRARTTCVDQAAVQTHLNVSRSYGLPALLVYPAAILLNAAALHIVAPLRIATLLLYKDTPVPLFF